MTIQTEHGGKVAYQPISTAVVEYLSHEQAHHSELAVNLPNFEIYQSQEGDLLTLRLTGELDLASAPLLKYRLEEFRAAKRQVRVDLSGLDFIDSSGIHLLIWAVNDARANGWQLYIKPGLSANLEHSFRMAKLERLIADDHTSGKFNGGSPA
jgi:anti-anti-sigma factor